MARISLNCSCGWNFFIPGTTGGHEVDCPSCGQSVRIPGRKPGQVAASSPGEIAAQKQRQQNAIKFLIGAALLVLLGGVGVAFFLGRSSVPEPGAGPGTRLPTVPIGERGTPSRPPASPVPGKSPDSSRGEGSDTFRIEDWKREIQTNIWFVNLATLVSEFLRYKNLTNEWAQLQADITRAESQIKSNLIHLAKAGEKMPLEPYLAQGDLIQAFVGRDFTTIKPEEGAAVLQNWLTHWQAGAALEQVTVLRGDKKITVTLFFPEDTKEMLAVVRHPALAVEPPPEPATPLPGDAIDLPPDLLKEIQTRFEALPPGYLAYLLPVDRKHLEDLQKTRKGTPEDIEWLKRFIAKETLPSFQREADLVRSKLLSLEPKLKEGVATDVLIWKSGSRLECQIVEETPEAVKVRAPGISTTIPRSQIQKIEKGKGVETEFPGKYAEARGNAEKLDGLLAWCTEKKLRVEKEYVAYQLLTLNAAHEKARAAVGLSRPVIAASPLPPARFAGGDDAARLELVDRTIEIMAQDVAGRKLTYADVIIEMQRRTESLQTTLPPFPPQQCAKGLSVISNPLTFKPRELAVPVALDIGQWWTGLSAEDRRQFAKYFGLWCAFMRAQMRR